MWYAGGKDAFPSAARQTQTARPPRSQSQTSLRPRRGGDAPPLGATQRPRADPGATWQRSTLRGARQSSGRVIGKSPPATAAALLSLSASQDLVGFEAAEAAQAKELLRVGPWSVRRAPGGPDAGLLYVNVETGRAQKEPPQEVLDELGMDEEDGEEPSQSSSPGPASGGGGSRGASRSASRGASRPGTAGSQGGGAQPASAAKFRRILLGNGRDVPLAMARDIHAALQEDVSIFDAAQLRFSDAPADESPMELDSLPEELECVAAALAPGEVSGVIGTEAGMQILLRVC